MAREVTHHHGQTHIGGLNRVFHCNHYNAYLQTAVLLSEGAGDCAPRRLLADAVVPLVRHLLEQGYSREDLIEEFSFCGFGVLREMTGGTWVTPHSHYGQAARLHSHGEKSCYFTAGYLTGMTGLRTEETLCKQQGSPVDWFKTGEPLDPLPPDYLRNPPPFTDTPPRFGLDGQAGMSTPIDEEAIIQAVSGLPLFGRSEPGETGLIDAFGVVLTNHFADYYNYISYETFFGMLDAGLPVEHCRDVFIQGGHICAFNTFGGIMSSPEWYNLIEPHCRNVEDWIHGMVAVINALGWGTWRVERIDPGRELVIRVYNSYEGVGFRRLYAPAQDRQLSFLVLGAVQGLAHLFWKIDIREKPQLDQDFYANVFNDPQGKFTVTQTHAIAAGDEYDRVVAHRD